MLHYTPFRYPGGKRRLASVVMRLLEHNSLTDVEYVEPFAGGAAVALGLLFDDYASTIHLNDFSRPVYAAWHSMLNETAWLCNRIEKLKISMAEWKRQRVVYDKRETADLAELGLAAIFLNRTNRSGIIRGGVIGGKSQSGEWSLDCRFNKAEIISRIKKIRRFSDRIKIYQMDGLQFTKDVVSKLPKNSFAFYDPPYIEFSRLLYMNNYRPKDHQALAEAVMKLRRPWIVTYDCAAIREKLYQGRRRIVYGLHYTAHEKRQGQEVMYFSDKLSLPKTSELLAERMELVPYMSRLKLA